MGGRGGRGWKSSEGGGGGGLEKVGKGGGGEKGGEGGGADSGPQPCRQVKAAAALRSHGRSSGARPGRAGPGRTLRLGGRP